MKTNSEQGWPVRRVAARLGGLLRQTAREHELADSIAHDLRTAIRSLRSNRAFAVAVITTLALAIGVNTVIFSAVEAVLFRPLPVPGLDRIVDVGHHTPALNLHYGLQAAEIFDLEQRRDLFDALAGYRSVNLNLTGTGAPQHIPAVSTTGGFFDVFGIRPYLGRLYDSDDERRGATSVVVLSFDLWRDLTGSDIHAVGRTLRLNDSSFMLLGVLPPGFHYPLGAELWTPKTLDIFLNRRATEDMLHAGAIVPTVARMKAGIELPQLQSELAAALRGWAARQPQYYATRAPRPLEARPFVETWAGQLRPILILLVGAVALVLVIACANVASLQLLRTTGRAREIAVRMALGGSRATIVRQFAVETLLLAVSGGAIGVAFAGALLVTVGRVAAVQIPELQALRRNAVVADSWYVDADYFRAMRIPFRSGPGFSGHEQDDQVRAYPRQLQVNVVIDATLAHRLFPGQNAIDKLIGPWSPGFRVVGVVGSVKQSDLGATTKDDEGAIYFATAGTQSALALVLRTRLPIGAAAAMLRNAVHELDPELAIFDVEPLPAMISRSVGPPQIASWLLAGFAGLLLILALLGVYGVLSYTTSQRSKEMGIRIALGATPGEILAIVARGAASTTGLGVLIGISGYVALERSLSAITYGVDAGDALMIGAVAATLVVVALLASLPAAIRAARVDPVQSLRVD